MIKASSPAKIHLIGEYSAIWGKPTILLPVNLRLEVSLTPGQHEEKKPFQLAIEKAIQKKFGKKVPPYSLKITSNIPIGSGVGSSAALSSSLTKAILSLLKIKATDEEIFQIALEGEKVFHGFPSGSDLWTVILNKPIWYQKETPNSIVVKPLGLKLPKNLFLINSGKPQESTKQMVAWVSKKISKKAQVKFANLQESLTKQMLKVLKNKDKDKFIEIIKKAHKNLATLGVISKSAQKIVKMIEKVGGAAKITGAGGKKEGSGMLIAFHKNPQKLKALAKKNSWKIIPIQSYEVKPR